MSTPKSYPFMLYFATAMSLLGSLQFGYHLGILNTCLDVVVDDLNSPSSGPVFVSTVLIAATLGALGAGPFADKVGPKRATVYNTFPFIIGTLLSFTASTATTMIFGRFLVGIAAGAASLFVPRYISEIAPTSIRGFLGTLHQIIINLGLVFAFAIGLPYQQTDPPPTTSSVFNSSFDIPWWRFMFMCGVVPAVVQCVGLSMCPETPVWLVFRGKSLEARKSLKRLHGSSTGSSGGGGNTASDSVLLEDALHHRDEDIETNTNTIDTIQQPLLGNVGADRTTSNPNNNNNNNNHQEGFKALFQPRYRRVMIIAATLPLLQQLSGINSVVLYGSQVLKTSGVSSPIIANLILGVDNTVSTIVAAALMDKAGRKLLLTVSYAGMGVCLLAMSTFLYFTSGGNGGNSLFSSILSLDKFFSFFSSSNSSSLAGTVSFISILLYIFFFALGSGPITWLYLPEILPPSIKGAAQSSVTALNWLSNFCIGMFFPSMMAVMGFEGAYAVFGVCCAVGAVFCARYMVETKQRSLAAIQTELMNN